LWHGSRIVAPLADRGCRAKTTLDVYEPLFRDEEDRTRGAIEEAFSADQTADYEGAENRSPRRLRVEGVSKPGNVRGKPGSYKGFAQMS
jgi:hypothetical protein